jgi:hypothetical protein
MRMTVVIGIAALSFVVTAADARAAGPCAKDAAKFCKGVKLGQGRLIRCMWQHRDELSPACQEKARQDWEKAMEVSADCAEDAKKFCQGIIPGGGRIIACLMSHEAELAPACKTHSEKARANIHEGIEKLVLGACKNDRDKFCKDLEPGEGRILDCLKANRARLKPACKAKLRRVESRQGK